MSSTPAPSTTTTASIAPAAAAKPQQPELLPLEEDDEFEDFAAEDWEEKDTYGAKLAGAPVGDGKTPGGLNSLWEDNWDDDDVADDFSVQLRGELAKQNQMQS